MNESVYPPSAKSETHVPFFWLLECEHGDLETKEPFATIHQVDRSISELGTARRTTRWQMTKCINIVNGKASMVVLLHHVQRNSAISNVQILVESWS